MKVSLKWLRDYVNIPSPLKDLAGKLTMAGLEVKSIEATGQNWEKIVVGQVTELKAHPNADHLQLVTVNVGQELFTVVSGAFNLKVGDKVPFAYVGAQLIDGHTGQTVQLKPAKIRGVSSHGMVCSEKELGLSEDHSGIMVLPPDAPVGIPLADFLGDAILELEVTSNRPDCLCVLGIAREVGALVKERVRPPQVKYGEPGPNIQQLATVDIADPDLCPRYTASLVLEVRVAPSPSWMQQRLLSCGMRPINNIVDATNYVMLEYGQPLHAFDLPQIRGRKIIVRRAKPGEKIATLDGMERTLTADMLAIADIQGAIAIAGVMGGAGSEVTESTTSVLLESANFQPVSIRRTSQSLRLRTEASLRFERGLSSELPPLALQRATQLIIELAGGKAAKGIIDVYPGKRETKPVLLSTSQVRNLLGMELSQEQIAETLTSLGFDCHREGDSRIWVAVPYWRSDVSQVADIVEEIARITGYDKIPTTMLSSPLPRQQPDPALTLREKVRDILASCGLQEIITYSLTSQEKLRRIAPSAHLSNSFLLRVANPMSSEQEYLRHSLLPGILSTLSANQKHEDSGIRLFEIGKIYLPQEKDLPEEKEIVAGVLSGPRLDTSWCGEKGWLGFYDAKGIVETLLQRLGVEAEFEPGKDEALHPGRTASIAVKGLKIGIAGELHPRIVESFDLLPQPVALFELELERLLAFVVEKSKYRPLSRFPSSRRDLAIVIDSKVPARKVQDIISSLPLVNQVTLFDLYTGEQIAAGKKSLAFRIVYQSPTHTLTEEEVNDTQQKILEKLSRELGATLRS